MMTTGITITDLFKEDKLTFLVGAGCSVDAPSCLPAGRKMIEDLIRYTCAESEIEKILDLEELRFEQLIEIVRDSIDGDLNVIDYYGQCDKPNLQHFFLAEMIKNGHFVMTTNFDFLIEYALQQSGVPNEEILPVITKKDFETNSNPDENFDQGKKAIYKVHGSTKNIITEEDTRKSLVTTIQAFGSNKERENVFQMEPFKRPLFENISTGRSLVILGYSGSDDFDIVPTLQVLKNLQNIIWINYSEKNEVGKELIYEIDWNTNQVLNELDKTTRKITQLLFIIWNMKNVEHAYRVDVNTSDLVKNLLKSKPIVSSKNFTINSRDWLEKNLEVPSNIIRYYIPYKIYYDLGLYEDAMNCSEAILHFAKLVHDKSWEADAFNSIATIHYAQGNYKKALKQYVKALQINEQLGDMRGKTSALNYIGEIYRVKNKPSKALKRFREALLLNEQLEDLSDKVNILINMGKVYHTQRKYIEAVNQYNEALYVSEKLGDLNRKATCLNQIGLILKAHDNKTGAMKYFKEALQIFQQLGGMSDTANVLNNIGTMYAEEYRFQEASNHYKMALEILNKIGLGDSPIVTTINGNIKILKKLLKKFRIKTINWTQSNELEKSSQTRDIPADTESKNYCVNCGHKIERIGSFCLNCGFMF